MKNIILIIFLTIPLLWGCRTAKKQSFCKEYEDCLKIYIHNASFMCERISDTNNVFIINHGYESAMKDSRKIVACGNFYSAMLAMRIGDFEYADACLDDAVKNWPENIEIVMLKLLCLEIMGETDTVVQSFTVMKEVEQPLPAYIDIMIKTIKKENIAKKEFETLTPRQIYFVKVLQELSNTSLTNIYNIKHTN